MLARVGGSLKVLSILPIAAAPLVTHFLLTTGDWHVAAALLIAGQAGLALWLVLTRLRSRSRQAAAIAVLAGSLTVCLLHLQRGLVLSTGLPHAVIYAGLLILFGLSLRPGRVPLVTALSHQLHGPLPPAIDRYTRRVTWAWCLFCLLQLAVSALLLSCAPVAWWSAFVNVLNAPLLAAMILGERATRPLWVANPPRERLPDMMRMIALVKVQLAKHDRGGPRPRET